MTNVLNLIGQLLALRYTLPAVFFPGANAREDTREETARGFTFPAAPPHVRTVASAQLWVTTTTHANASRVSWILSQDLTRPCPKTFF